MTAFVRGAETKRKASVLSDVIDWAINLGSSDEGEALLRAAEDLIAQLAEEISDLLTERNRRLETLTEFLREREAELLELGDPAEETP